MNPIYTATAHSSGDGRNGHVRSDDGFGLAAALVIYAPRLDKATAESLVESAHKVCPYSDATRGNIEVTLSVIE